MGAIYKHGTYGEIGQSIGRAAINSGTVAVYVGLAPVNLLRGAAAAAGVNAPVLITGKGSYERQMGYSADWAKFSLCEAFKAHFNNPDGNVGPIVAINVLDPAVHKAGSATTASLSFVNGRATIQSDTIILDSLELTDKTEGTDYSVDYDFTKGQVIIDSLGSTPITGTVQATYDTVDVTAIDKDDIIGGVTSGGEYTGLGVVQLINQTLAVVPNLIAAPGWSHFPDVYAAMIVAGTNINEQWNAFVVADIPLMDNTTPVDTIEAAKTWAAANGYTNEKTKPCWPQWKAATGEVYHLSTMNVWQMQLTDATHNGVPMESPSNKPLPAGRQYFGENSQNKGFDKARGNELNAVGISTAVYFGNRWVLWGPHTGAYRFGAVTDNRVIFDVNMRMLMHVLNKFHQRWGADIDQPMTRAKADTVKAVEQEEADALAAMGAFIGTPVVSFNEEDNTYDDLVQGDFRWAFEGTPTPPWKSGTMGASYSSEGFSSYFGKDGE